MIDRVAMLRLAGVHIQWCHGDIHVHIWRYSTLVQLTPVINVRIHADLWFFL